MITQNIDGLHQAAGSKVVYEVHGSTLRNYCDRCGKKYPSDAIYTSEEAVPHCSCGGKIRPDVTLYGEMLPSDAWSGAGRPISRADLLIVGGPLTVYPPPLVSSYRANILSSSTGTRLRRTAPRIWLPRQYRRGIFPHRGLRKFKKVTSCRRSARNGQVLPHGFSGARHFA